MRIATAQMAPTADSVDNLALIQVLTARAAEQGCELIVFPEEAMVAPTDENKAEMGVLARAAWPVFVAELSRLARHHGIAIVAAGYEPNHSDKRPFNTMLAMNSEGEILAKYRKLHLYDAFTYRESDYATHGTELPPVFTINGLCLGLANCYDIRFPELFRSLVDRGADAFVVSAAWVSGSRKEEHWQTLLRARAIENTCWVIASGSSGAGCIGQSVVLDPMGIALAGAGDDAPAIAIAVIDAERIERVRAMLPSLANRRITSFPVVTQPQQ